MPRIPALVPLAPWERTAQLALFMLVMLAAWRGAWLQHAHDPYEFLRHGNDSLGYYQWLPATFIHFDWSRMFWCHQMENGNWISLFTLGVAVLQLPFFLVGHAAAFTFGYDLNGFSAPYGVAMMLGGACYTAAGCVVSFRLARRFSAGLPALIAAALLFVATNVYFYAVREPMMSHNYALFLIGLYAYCSLRVLDGPRGAHVLLLVLSGALIVLVRQLNVFSLLFPLLVAGSKDRVRLFFSNLLSKRASLISGLALGMLPWALQMIYWHWTTGEAITFTYGKKGEGFEWDKMVPGLVVLGVRNGWLVYTPLMIAVMTMLIRRAWQGIAPARTVLLLTCITWLLYSAWWSWHLGSGYGHRGFIDLYALLAVPLAWLIQAVMSRGLIWRMTAAITVIALVQLNMGLIERYDWFWSWEDWTWKRLFEQVSDVVIGK